MDPFAPPPPPPPRERTRATPSSSVRGRTPAHRYRELPCVTGPPHLACLAAAPLVASPGEAAAGAVYGSLVVADTKPRTFTAVQLEMLGFSAGSLVRDLEWAAQAARQGQAQRAQQALLRCAQETVEGHAGGRGSGGGRWAGARKQRQAAVATVR